MGNYKLCGVYQTFPALLVWVNATATYVNRHVPLGAVRYGGPRASITQAYHLTFKVHKNRHIV